MVPCAGRPSNVQANSIPIVASQDLIAIVVGVGGGAADEDVLETAAAVAAKGRFYEQ